MIVRAMAKIYQSLLYLYKQLYNVSITYIKKNITFLRKNIFDRQLYGCYIFYLSNYILSLFSLKHTRAVTKYKIVNLKLILNNLKNHFCKLM